MSVTYHATGTVGFDEPVPLASFWELLESPHTPWHITPSIISDKDLRALLSERERLLLPADEATIDAQGRPSHIKGFAVDWATRSHVIGSALRNAVLAVYSGGQDLEDYDIAFACEDGSKGEIVFYADEDTAVLGWEENYAPGRVPEVFGCLPWDFQTPRNT
ncbi:hypothetical protein ACF09H_22120 [Streptomyces sp. NPDC014983]|uniref:hypothetical protein n=1 Tax=Streptomyces sp. NPDC014983 TaxID=3364933 RepID=UPI0036FF986B